MIRLLQKEDLESVTKLVNHNWRTVYRSYVSKQLLNKEGCANRTLEIENEFFKKTRQHYVYESCGRVLALLTLGETTDDDKKGAFEIWRLYVLQAAQNRGIGSQLIQFAETRAAEQNYGEILLWAFKENKKAALFYEKHGYVKSRELELGEPYLARSVRFSKLL